MSKKRKLNTKIWKSEKERDKYYQILLKMKVKKLKYFPIKIEYLQWCSITAMNGGELKRNKIAKQPLQNTKKKNKNSTKIVQVLGKTICYHWNSKKTTLTIRHNDINGKLIKQTKFVDYEHYKEHYNI